MYSNVRGICWADRACVCLRFCVTFPRGERRKMGIGAGWIRLGKEGDRAIHAMVLLLWGGGGATRGNGRDKVER